MNATRTGVAAVWSWLGEIADPEIPAISIVDLGIVRDVAWVDGGDSAVLRVTLTPTYSGCPATRVIEREVTRTLRARGIESVDLAVRLAPPWTTDWISDAGRDKLRAYGISAPQRGGAASIDTTAILEMAAVLEPQVVCPRCASVDAALISRFGSTPCKALYRCNVCREPFDHFKCH